MEGEEVPLEDVNRSDSLVRAHARDVPAAEYEAVRMNRGHKFAERSVDVLVGGEMKTEMNMEARRRNPK